MDTFIVIASILLLIAVLALYLLQLNKNKKLQAKTEDTKNALRDSENLFQSILQNVNAFILLINRDFIVDRTNYYDITNENPPTDHILRVGDMLRCDNALHASGGCGTHDHCKECAVRNTIENNFLKKSSFSNL